MSDITGDNIAAGLIVEDQQVEFKRELDLSDPRKKRDFVDDVVAFLNAGAGRIVVGVAEKAGRFERFQPFKGDRDATARRLLSIVQDNVVPKPLGVSIAFIEIEEGALIDVLIPSHGMRPYQNTINGAFLLRTGAKNTPLQRDAVRAMFTPVETMEADAVKLMAREDRAIQARAIMQTGCPTLHVAIVPGAHYDRSAAPFDSSQGIVLKTFSHYHYEGSHGGLFKGCEGGVEARDATFDEDRSTSRLFIGDDWLIHSMTAHPFRVDDGEGRLTLYEFEKALPRHMRDIALLLEDAKTVGPFCILIAVRGLAASEKMKWAFPHAETVTLPRGVVVERLDDPSVTERFYQLVRRASIYG